MSVENVGIVETESALNFCVLPVLRKSTNEVYKHRNQASIRAGSLRWLSGCYLLQNRSLQFHIPNEVICLPRSAPPSRRPLQGIYPAIHSATFLFAGFLPNHSHPVLTDFDVIDAGQYSLQIIAVKSRLFCLIADVA